MAAAIGAGTKILMCTATTPTSALNGGSDSNLVDVTDFFTAFNLSSSIGSIDVTTLSIGAAEGWARRFIAGLRTNTASGNYLDSPQGTVFRQLIGIGNGTAHTKGRAKVDFQVKIGGAVSGNMKWDFTAFFTASPFDVGIETALGGSFSAQVDGLIAVSTQA